MGNITKNAQDDAMTTSGSLKDGQFVTPSRPSNKVSGEREPELEAGDDANAQAPSPAQRNERNKANTFQ
jgi:hypothetical protein